MGWFSWPAAAITTVAGVGLGIWLADEVGAMADARRVAPAQSYASLTPHGERPAMASADDAPVAHSYAPVYGCTNCARARATYAAADRYARAYGPTTYAAVEYGPEPGVLADPPPAPVTQAAETAEIDLYTRYPVTEAERELQEIQAGAARDAAQRRAVVTVAPPAPVVQPEAAPAL